MKSKVLIKSGQSQKHFRRSDSSRRTGYIPFCHKCGKPMKMDWSDSITGNKQVWRCRLCFRYRIVNTSSNIDKITF